VRSGREESLDAEITLRVKGRTPELWQADTGRIEDAPAWEATADGRTRLWLSLEPYGSVFIVFRRLGAAGRKPVPRTPLTAPVNGPWTVRFTPGWGAPAQATFDKLISWSEHADAGIRYFSGTARYAAKVNLPPGREWTLDLGEVREIAEVWLNGKPSACCGRSRSPWLWARPRMRAKTSWRSKWSISGRTG